MTVNGRRVFCWPLTATHFLLALPCPKQQSIVGTKQSNGRMVIDSHQHGRFGGGGGGHGIWLEVSKKPPSSWRTCGDESKCLLENGETIFRCNFQLSCSMNRL
jgi:hypothetical protein